jgi:prophage tail gpP-like protein
MSKSYTVQAGDTFESISSRVYGDPSESSRIESSNQNQASALSPGTVLIIPDIPERESLRTSQASKRLINKASTDLTIIIGNQEVLTTSARIIRTMDTPADGWSAIIPWTPGENPDLDELIKPFRYPTASAYIGHELMVNGLLYSVGAELSASGRIKNLGGFSFTADAIDSTLKPPYERNNVTLKQVATELIQPLGISAEFDTDLGGQFSRVTADPTETIISHLSKLATQRGGLISSTPEGNLLFTKTGTGATVGTLEEGGPFVTRWGAEYDGRNLHNTYRAIGQSPGKNSKVAIAKNKNVPRARFITFRADDTTEGDILNSAEWKRSKILVDAMTMDLPVADWFDPSGKLWRENTFVNVISSTLDLPNGFLFLIRAVEYVLDDSGRSAVLSIIPPQAYSGEAIPDIWA